MKILQVCYKPPSPPVDGGTLGMDFLTQGFLEAGCEVKVLTVYSDKHPVLWQYIDENYLAATRFEAVYIDLSLHALPAIGAMMCGESYHAKRFESRDFDRKLRQILESEKFDIIQVESIYLASYIETMRRHSQAPVVLRAPNVEHKIWTNIAKGTSNLFKRQYIKHLALTLAAFERERVPQFDAIVSVTEQDAKEFKQMAQRRPVEVVPFGIKPPVQADNVSVEPYSLYHIGSMDWQPNQEGIDWFLKEVWPLMHEKLPQVRLYLAGRKMSTELLNSNIDGVSIVGEVEDANYFIASKQINVVPLLSGSGIRVKIVEAMASGKTVVSTTIGAMGIDYTDGQDILIADTPEQFVEQVSRCINDDAFCKKVGANAAELIEKKYSRQSLTKKLLQFYDRMLAKADDDADE